MRAPQAHNPVRKVFKYAGGRSMGITLPSFVPFRVGDLILVEKTESGVLLKLLKPEGEK